MFRVRHRLMEDDTRKRYGFLFSGFRAEFFFWESLIMLRKVGIAVLSVFLAPAGMEVQTYCALLLVFVATVLNT